jgi:peptidoglycan hydrolase-like protein with peptidoglycan-binding domain
MSNKQLIYKLLRNAGITEAGALGILGNWQAESGCEPGRLQNDFSSYRTVSKDYTARVTSGAISRQEFARDQKGYGLAQWTYFNFSTGQGRKLALYDFWKKSGKALDDVTMQVAFALHELTTEGQYAKLLSLLKTTNDIFTATDQVCRVFEQPYYCNVDERYRYAKEIASEIDLSGSAVVEENATTEGVSVLENTTPKLETWPPRVIDEHCTGWPEVWLLQALLKCHGANVLIDGIWGQALTDKVKRYQEENGLEPDGAVGPMSWAKLMER